MIRIVLADDHNIVRQGIRALLEKAAGLQVIGEAENGYEAVQLVEKLAPDVLVMDVSMPRLNGTQALEQLGASKSTTRVIILSMYSDETLVQKCLQLGARGYLLKRSVSEELALAIQAAVRGEVYLSPAVSSALLENLLTRPAGSEVNDPLAQLTAREREVLKLIAEGHSNPEVAELLSISQKTVEKHRASLMTKLNVHDVTALVRLAIKYGLVSIEG